MPSSTSGSDTAPASSTAADQQQQVQQQQRHSQQHSQQQRRSTVSAREAAKFAALAGEWWDPAGPFAPLHAMNPVRCRFLRSALCVAFGRDTAQPRPLAGLRLLDIGCGGGLLAESLARMGAHVTGIDVNEGGIATAQAHAALDPDLAGCLHYRTASAEQLVAAGECFDAGGASAARLCRSQQIVSGQQRPGGRQMTGAACTAASPFSAPALPCPALPAQWLPAR